MTDYNWRTDDDVDWDMPESRPDEPRPPRRLRWLLPLAILLVITIVSFLVYRQARLRTEATASKVAQDILGSIEITNRAYLEQDRDLFVSSLSGSNEQWTETQLNLFERGELYDRPTFGLAWDGFDRAAEEQTVQLGASFQSAEISRVASFKQHQPDGSDLELKLELNHVYRVGLQNRWLFSPPADSFWGDSQTISGTRLQMQVPARDNAWFSELAIMADESLIEICLENRVLRCTGFLPYTVVLSTDPASLISSQSGPQLLGEENQLTLPTISLVGLPQDDISNELLQRAYLRQIVMGFLADRLDYECCLRAIFLQAMTDYFLDEQALLTYPRSQQSYDILLNELIDIRFDSSRRLGGLNLYWQDSEWHYIYALIDYIFETTEETASFTILNEILDGATAVSWLAEDLGLPAENSLALDASWFRFLAANRNNASVIIEGREAQLLCAEAGSDFSQRYRLLTEIPGLELVEGPDLGYRSRVIPLGDNSGVVVPVTDSNGTASLEVQYFDGRILRLAPPTGNGGSSTYTGRYSPDYSKLLTFNDTAAQEQSFSIYDLTDCPDSNCQPHPVSGYGNWSPDGRHYAYFGSPNVDYTDIVITEGLGQNPQNIPVAGSTAISAPDWLDNTQLLISRGEQIVRYDIESGRDSEIINFDTIRNSEVLGELDGSEFIFLTQLSAIEGYSQQYLISGQISGNGRQQESFLLRFDEANGTLEKIVSDATSWILPLEDSFGSNWLTIFQFAINRQFELSSRADVTMYNYQTGTTFDFVFDTSASILVQPVAVYENWMLVPGNGFIRLIDAAAGEQHYIFPEQGLTCSAAFWTANE